MSILHATNRYDQRCAHSVLECFDFKDLVFERSISCESRRCMAEEYGRVYSKEEALAGVMLRR